MYDMNTPNEAHASVRRLLHVLWTKAVGTSNYNKAEWKQMDGLIEQLIYEARHA